MSKQVFHYRTGGGYFLFGFLSIFAIVFCGMPLYAIITGNPISINDRMVTFQEAPLMYAPFLAVGVGTAIGDSIFLAWLLTARFEVENGRVRHYTRFGKLRFDEPIANIKVEGEKAGSSDGMRKLVLDVNGRKEKVWNSITRYTELKRLLETKSVTPEAEPVARTEPVALYYPSERVFHYRYSYLHWMSCFLTGFMGVMVVMLFSGSISNADNPWLMLAFMSPFFMMAAWLQLTGWVEQIKLGPNGIEWRDWKGKIRCSVSLNEIVDKLYQPGEAPYYIIETKQGEIRANSYLKGFNDLMGEVDKVVGSRRRR